MKKVVIVHGFNGKPESNWFPWLKAELEKAGHSVEVPAMPSPEAPKLKEWVARLAEVAGEPSEDTFVIGHSLGCPTILNYLQQLDGKIGGALLVAGFAESLGNPAIEEFTAIEWSPELINESCGAIKLINTDNDQYIDLSIAKRMQDMLGASMRIMNGAFHISERHGYTEVPEILQDIKELLGE